MNWLRQYGSSLSSAARLRLTNASWSIVETPVAAGLAWYVAHGLLGHHQPFFAPSAATLSLSKNRVLRGQRALQPHAQLIAGLVEICADDTLRLTGETTRGRPDSGKQATPLRSE